MRKFKLFIQDAENDETVIEYPIPTHFMGNGLGGGTETPQPTYEEKLAIIDLMTSTKIYALGKGTKPDAPGGNFSAMCDVSGCGYTSGARTFALAEANVKLHKRFKHEGAKVGVKP